MNAEQELRRVKRMILVHPGADFSTADVYHGYTRALQAMGVPFTEFSLNKWMAFYSKAYSLFAEKEGIEKKLLGPDELYALASTRGVIKALYDDAEVAFIFSAMMFHPDALVMLKRAGKKVGIFFTESPYDDEKQLKLAEYADWIFLNDPTNIEDFKAINPNTWYLPHAVDPNHHMPGVEIEDKHKSDVVIVGTGFPERIRLLEQINWDGINLKIIGLWDLITKSSPLKPFYQAGCIDNDETVQYYNGAKICLNIHRSSKGFGVDAFKKSQFIDKAHSLNPRAYEIAACGAFQICDGTRPELAEVFGGSVPTFENAEGLENLIRNYLASDQLREKLAAEAQEKVKEETFTHRASFLIENITLC